MVRAGIRASQFDMVTHLKDQACHCIELDVDITFAAGLPRTASPCCFASHFNCLATMGSSEVHPPPWVFPIGEPPSPRLRGSEAPRLRGSDCLPTCQGARVRQENWGATGLLGPCEFEFFRSRTGIAIPRCFCGSKTRHAT